MDEKTVTIISIELPYIKEDWKLLYPINDDKKKTDADILREAHEKAELVQNG
jgi:hypothetical protein